MTGKIRIPPDCLESICKGKGELEDIAKLEKLSEAIKGGSLCGLGQTAPNPVLSSLKYFRNEFLAHIKDKRCPALVCTALISYVIDPRKCSGCTICAKKCPNHVISGEPKKVHTIDQATCIRCGICISVCPDKFNAIKKVSPAIK